MQVFVVISDNYEELTHQKIRGVFTSVERAEEYISYLRDDNIYACIVESEIDRFFDVDGSTFYWHCVLQDALNPLNGRFYIDRLSEQYLAVNGVPKLNSVIYDIEREQCRVYVSALKQDEAEAVGHRLLIDAAQDMGFPVQLGFNFSFSGKLVG